MTKQEARDQAITRIKGQEVKPGTIVGAESDPLTWRFLEYNGLNAICEGKDNERKEFLRSEIFDVRKVINVANHLLNIGFWNEGMESMILSL